MRGKHHIFTVNEKSEEIDEERSGIFYSVTTSMLYLMKRALPDLETIGVFSEYLGI